MYTKPSDRISEALHLTKKKLHIDFWALSNVSFMLERGKIMGIIGRNGSGKSTLLKILTGVVSPTSGHVEVTGKISSLLELGAGFNSEYTGIENIFFYCTLMGMTKKKIQSKLHDIIDFAEIGDYIHQPIKTYSSGMFARLAFSCAINVEPDVLIVDEILSVGDIRFQAKCFNKFKKFKEQGVTILYVGHDISLMRTFCDVCMWLDNGKIVEIGEPVYISSKYTEYMYLNENTASEDRQINLNLPITGTEIDEQSDLVSGKDIYEQARDSGNPFSHWGSHIGMIQNVKLVNTQKKSINHFAPHETILIEFDVKIPVGIETEYLSAAFSIKNREGLDLIVNTTFNAGILLSGKQNFHISFSVCTLLNSGEYYLVLALENRKNAMISYYEYIEGAKFFKVFHTKDIYGLYLPDVSIVIEEEEQHFG